jgi:hypothetical protein
VSLLAFEKELLSKAEQIQVDKRTHGAKPIGSMAERLDIVVYQAREGKGHGGEQNEEARR